ncbi:inositol monophosphatase family protein [Bdellovibrio sp. 22V]|uniref:inositol monophosphatase family protein n=1 Tax=Bdellovibrio sp. 22V TaxID=3044166 RepID=UPI002542EFC3|nr:inositol monophosphatase family protein [Bdellovibrio sp. 22V]WII73114.1 inositol monophosphatase family protein [Bdellovibrio sp. 22V]
MESGVKSMDWKQVLGQAIKAVSLGREVLLNYFGNLEHIEEKFQAGLVSEADKESERVIAEHLKKNFPTIEFLGEETFAAKHAPGAKVQAAPAGPEGRWILDPLDGTTNYIHRFPIFCISLGLEINGQMQLAVIDVPMLKETYTAIRGQGAFVNGRPLRVSKTAELGKALLATGFVAEHEHVISEQLKVFGEMVRECRGVRRPGAAAYDLAQVARGVFDGYWERNIQPWDAAAGILLVEEAGGVVETYRGEKYHPYKNSIVAGNKDLVREMQKVLQNHVSEETH